MPGHPVGARAACLRLSPGSVISWLGHFASVSLSSHTCKVGEWGRLCSVLRPALSLGWH